MYRPKGTLLFLLTLASLVGGGLAKSRREEEPSVTDVPSHSQSYGVSPNTSHSSSSTATRDQQQFGRYSHPKPADVPVGCTELRSKRYISDGFCTSIKPITEVVCTGHCLPIRELPWYAEFIKVWARTKIMEWRCVEDVVRRKKVRLLCQNGEPRTYRIKVVKSCKCKRYMRQQNESQGSYKRNGKHHRRKGADRSNDRPNSSNRFRP